ncbi:MULTISPECIES: DUF2489 domain-containing protein [unclassified Agarivorans]|nr:MULTISPECIES: DUF2489 domain-containing protein [unclassified Agarivorans]MDO6685638.1 DUF2489 domain-containing protein [Agarivorans sp. 3_MG-2023]MDO6716247.1 DUF2489 domain-containing protein [Agarivorans sp. 2_MG-2023]
MVWWLVAATVIVVALAVYAALLVGRLLGQRKVIQHAVAKRNENLVNDIRYIAKAMQEDRCGLSEGVIRVSNLLLALQTPELIDWAQRFPSVFQLYNAVKELPTHEARNILPLQQRMRQDLEREAEEKALEKLILQEAEALTQLSANAL